MKLLILVAFVLFAATTSFSQHDPVKMGYLTKSEKYRRMKHTGTTLTVVGSVLLVVGVTTMANSSITQYSNGQTTTTGHPYEGTAAVLLGAAGLGTGIPFWIIGAKKEKQYYKRFENASLRLNVTPRATGLTFSYRF